MNKLEIKQISKTNEDRVMERMKTSPNNHKDIKNKKKQLN